MIHSSAWSRSRTTADKAGYQKQDARRRKKQIVHNEKSEDDAVVSASCSAGKASGGGGQAALVLPPRSRVRSFGRQVLLMPKLKLELQVYHCSMFIRQLMATAVSVETTISIAAIDEAVQRDGHCWARATGICHVQLSSYHSARALNTESSWPVGISSIYA